MKETELRGTFAYDAPLLIEGGQLAIGDRLLLVREPTNIHDPNAIAVFAADSKRLGYLPTGVAGGLFQYMDTGNRVDAVVVKLSWKTSRGRRYPSIKIMLEIGSASENSPVNNIPSALVSEGLSNDLMSASKRLRGKSGVYAIQHRINGKHYVGSSTNVGSRLLNHFKNLQNGTHEIKSLQTDWTKDGPEAFTCRLIKAMPGCVKSQLEREESKQVKRLKAYPSGYNRTQDGTYYGGKWTADQHMKEISRILRNI